MKEIIRRIASSIVLIIVVSFVTFFMLMLIPGDAVEISLGTEATPERVTELRAALGMDAPWYTQYMSWFTHALAGDFGVSFTYGENVTTLLLSRLPVTLSLMLMAIVIAVPLALTIGVIAALKQNKTFDIIARTLMQMGDAMPQFWIALIFLVYIAAQIEIFPISGFTPFSESVYGGVMSLFLPAVVLAFGMIATLIRIVRSSMLHSLKQDYMLMTRVSGVHPVRAIIKYPLRDALIAPLTVIGIQISGLISGVIVVESIFSLPGVGRLLFSAVLKRDLFLILGLVSFIVTSVIIITLITDILYILLNKKMRRNES
ncbi:ABC transporter permease [Phocicoccus pinnipedialis]|uniref:Glutathione transport system permease protein GsiC n=1 Tax=Phocicoccus pinnipedialis TaxID=110845 RepID=A0A6V7R4D7_9BACL|nr:ABC transporter permease [Jeotgalicoccus pinnipedialis]MBP1939677.1 peptide/nickel transport system permease protein [Jeotgalicoccus pinnipedialis]CAD2072299.1 Glutathione transport system permease protein GsiC [Jeotgalicoccus pinnipedialis]